MNLRILALTVGALLSLLWHPSFSDDVIELSAVRGPVEMRDLTNIASELGLRIELFDYESTIPHCIHLYVDESVDGGPTVRHDGNGHCGVAGKHRLTISWKIVDGKARFGFKRYHRDFDQGGGIGGPTITVSNSDGHTLFRIDPPRLSMNAEAVLVHGAYGSRGKTITDFKVIAELRPNAEGIVGTE